MDSKFWFSDEMPAAAGYETLLRPPVVKQDLAAHLNALLHESQVSTINAAVEESTLGERASGLLPHDQFIADNLDANDVVVLSVGGNDVVLKPSASTVWNMLLLLMQSTSTVAGGPDSAWGMSHFVRLFRDDIERFLGRLTAQTKPRRIIVCMIYFPCTQPTGGWADRALGLLGYFRDPKKLQTAIQQMFVHAVSKIQVPGVEVVPFPLFSVLDGSDASLYECGVEPSARGNEAIALALLEKVTDR